MEKRCWNIRKIKKIGQGLPEELGKYIWLAKADTSQEAPVSKSGSSSLVKIVYKCYNLAEKYITNCKQNIGEYMDFLTL